LRSERFCGFILYDSIKIDAGNPVDENLASCPVESLLTVMVRIPSGPGSNSILIGLRDVPFFLLIFTPADFQVC
jgi:hypothetical protein